MTEWALEQRLCAHLEATGALVARQLGTGVSEPANRVADVVLIDSGPQFDTRRQLTDTVIPSLVLEADVGVGRARYWKDTIRDLEIHPERARSAIDRAIEIGFLEAERRNGRLSVRQAARYPADWFGELTAIEVKPDLDRPGDLATQLRTDVSLSVVDRVVLATTSHVTRAHLHQFPDPVGVWRVSPEEPTHEVVRTAEQLPVKDPGIELLSRQAGRADISIVESPAKTRARRRLAERAYGKGWRPEAPIGCEHATVRTVAGVGGLPACSHFDRLVDPPNDCGSACPAYEPAEPPSYDRRAARDRHSPWVAAPPGRARRQGTLERYRNPDEGPQSS